jgi:hypothetical protein
MVGKLIGVAILVAIGFGVYKIGHSVGGEAKVVQTVAIGIPNHAAATVAEANLQQAASAASSYFGAHDSYAGMTTASLLEMNPGLANIQVKSADATSYCLEDDLRGETAHLDGPSGTASAGPCP